MVFSFSSEKLIERGYDRLSGISLPGGRALWYPEWLFVRISVALIVLMAIVGSLGLLMLMIGAADAASALMAAAAGLAIIDLVCIAVGLVSDL